MTGHHTHTHTHTHDESHSEMTFEEKVNKLLEHWIKHNDDHAATYREWADRAQKEGMDEIAGIIHAAAAKNISINDEFKQALELLKQKR